MSNLKGINRKTEFEDYSTTYDCEDNVMDQKPLGRHNDIDCGNHGLTECAEQHSRGGGLARLARLGVSMNIAEVIVDICCITRYQNRPPGIQQCNEELHTSKHRISTDQYVYRAK